MKAIVVSHASDAVHTGKLEELCQCRWHKVSRVFVVYGKDSKSELSMQLLPSWHFCYLKYSSKSLT